jgi:hypothetical protein
MKDSRRSILRAGGASGALPLLDAMVPVFGRAARTASALPPKQMVPIRAPLGWMRQFFFPQKPIADRTDAVSAPTPFPSSPYLELLAELRGQVTLCFGLSHPDVQGANHGAGQCFFTRAPHPNDPRFRNTQSLDQCAVEKLNPDTRFPSLAVPALPGVRNETHDLSHHGNEPEKISPLRMIEEEQTRFIAYLLTQLCEVQEHGATLLNRTQVLCGSCSGSANSHSNSNLPILIAGGGYEHPGNLSFSHAHNEPRANLYLTMLQRLGIEVDSFSSSTGTLRGLAA